MRLYERISGGTTLRLAYDGLDRIAEYDGSNALQRRYVHGPNIDEPLVWYEGSGTTDRRFLSSDERGSIISLTDSSGALLGINRYDEFGQPQATNFGVWGYSGQAWAQGIGVWYYKARHYDPELGRFLQTDPIDVLGSINLYAYVGNDPINFTDPSGLRDCGLNRVEVGGGVTTAPDGTIVIQPGVCVPVDWLVPRSQRVISSGNPRGAAPGRPGPTIPAEHRRTLSQCWLNALNKNAPGFDWATVEISDSDPAIGMAASTAPGVIYAGPNYNTIDRSLPLFVHELGHLPQWASGRLTAAQYFMESIAVGLLVIHGQIPISDQGIIATIHDQIDVEQDATAFSASFLAKYGKGGPCG